MFTLRIENPHLLYRSMLSIDPAHSIQRSLYLNHNQLTESQIVKGLIIDNIMMARLMPMLPGIIAAFAFVVSLFGGAYCKFIAFTSTDGEDPVSLYFGIWYYQGWSVVNSYTQGTIVLETCLNYPDSGVNVDSKWRAARAFSIIALVVSGVVTFWALLACCFYPSKKSYQIGGMIYLLCCLFQGLTLLFLDSSACHNNSLMAEMKDSISFQSSCSMAAGANCAIAGTVLFFLAAIAALKVDPPIRKPITQEPHVVTYTKTTGADGSAVVSETVVKGEPITVGGQQKVEQDV